jgi:hypothetical protein
MAGYLIRVGLDSGEIGGGGHAPIEYDGNFDYIPIPEDTDTTENTTYDTFSSRIGIDASDQTDREGDATLHHDPKFEPSYTYGEVGTKKRQSLRKLTNGDLLVFYSSLRPRTDLGSIRLYIIGYFTVDAVHDLEELTPEEREEIFKEYPDNAHIKRENLSSSSRTPGRDNYPVVVSGNPDRSSLLESALPLTSPTISGAPTWYRKYRPLSTPTDLLDINATDLKRSMPKKLRGNPDKIRAWLEGDFTQEVKSRANPPKHYPDSRHGTDTEQASIPSRVRGYVLETDSGFAPHIHQGLLSLATCAPMVRSKMYTGDWVFGIGSRHYPTRRELVYAFRVEYIPHMSEYYTEPKFSARKPLPENENPAGDNIYAPRSQVEQISIVDGSELPANAGAESGKRYERGEIDGEMCYTHRGGDYFQLHSGYHDLSNYKTDIEKQGNREKVLISSDFYYFGGNAVTVREDIAELVVPGFGGHDGRNSGHIEKSTENVAAFVEWLRSNYRVGIHGEPKHSDSDINLTNTTGPGC